MKSHLSKITLAALSFGLVWSCDMEEFGPSVAVESVTLNKQTMELVVGQCDSLVATVLPENASDKSVVWTSSDDSVVAVSEGAISALSAGTAVITVATEDGKKTAQCTVVVLTAAQPGSLDGMFSVADGRRIRFAEGNLRYALADSTWGFYSEQYLCGPGLYTDGHNVEISLFTWGYGAWSVSPDTKDHSNACVFAGQTLANSVDWGTALAETGSWRTLTNEEWNYILKERDGAADKCKYGVSVCGQPNCLVIAPDNFTGTIEESYTQQTWAAAEQNDGLVCLPAAGVRNGDIIYGVGENGRYWTASSAGIDKALSISTKSAPALTSRGANKLAARTGLPDSRLVPANANPVGGTSVQSFEQCLGNDPKPISVLLSKGQKLPSVSNDKQQGALTVNNKIAQAPVKASKKVANEAKQKTADPTPLQESYDTIPVTVASYQAKYYASSLDWQVIMADAAGNGYSFDIFAPAEGLESGKTYTSDNGDFDLDYTFAQVNKVNDSAVKASFTKTETEDALTVTAEMTTAAKHVYQFTYVLDKTVEVVDAHGIIIQPAKGTTKEYNRLATNTCFYYNNGTKLAYQSGTATLVECADGTVYWKDPVSKYASGTWIKGKKEGSTITFATKQPVSYNTTYKASLSVRWGNFNTQKFAAADDYADSFILDIKGDSLIMRGTQATTGSTATYFPGIFYDDDDSFTGYGDCGVNLYIPGWTPSTELITPPAGLVTAKMPFTGSGATTEYADSVLVGWDKDIVYIQGLAVDFPTAWIKGVLKEGVVTFEKFQYVGNYGTMPIWVLGTNGESELLDFTMTYDAQANLFKATNIFVVNASYEKIYYLDKVSKIVIGEVAQADWGEWEDFAPFGFNTGSWTFVAMATSPETYSNYVALVRTDKNNADNKQIKITNWGEGWFGDGVELIINWNAKDNTCSIDKQFTGYVDTQYGSVYVASVEDGTYNPETATFSIKVDYSVSAGSFGTGVETYVMDKPITQRDTVDIVSTALKYNDLIASNGVVIYYALDVPDYYLFRVTSNNATSVDGTFKWSDGTINDPNSYFSVSGTDKNYFQDGEFTVVTNKKDISLTGWMIGKDEKYYRLNMSYTAPTERDTLRFSGRGVAISECVSSQTGVQTGWLYDLVDASTGYEFLLQSTVVDNKYGTFSYEDGTLGSNYYNVLDPKGGRQQFFEGSITVSEVGDSLVFDGVLVAEDEKAYVLHFTQPAGVLDYDTDDAFDATFAWSDMDASITDGVIGIYATNAEGRTIGLELYADPAATEIPAGVYTISDSQEAGTALKSLGVSGGYLTECWAGTRGTSGIEDCWFLVEGIVTLSYDEYSKLNVEVDATNSWGQPVKAKVTYEFVALDPISRENGYSVRLVSDVE